MTETQKNLKDEIERLERENQNLISAIANAKKEKAAKKLESETAQPSKT